jgi:hypothetical protein
VALLTLPEGHDGARVSVVLLTAMGDDVYEVRCALSRVLMGTSDRILLCGAVSRVILRPVDLGAFQIPKTGRIINVREAAPHLLGALLTKFTMHTTKFSGHDWIR